MVLFSSVSLCHKAGQQQKNVFIRYDLSVAALQNFTTGV